MIWISCIKSCSLQINPTSGNQWRCGGLEELRACLQECASPTSALADDLSPQKSIKDESSIGVMQRLAQKLAKEKEHNDELEAQCVALKDENEIAAATTERGSGELTHTNLTNENDARAENKASKKTERKNKESLSALSSH
jgi:hypothetical protein